MSTRLLLGSAAVALAAAVAAAPAGANAPKAPTAAKVMIRHQLRGCHSWSVNGSAFNATQSVTLGRGATITFTNNDVMPHTLLQQGGPAATFFGNAAMAHIGATLKVKFMKAGVYRFTTKAGEDYVAGVKTIGEDNVLRLTVAVTR